MQANGQALTAATTPKLSTREAIAWAIAGSILINVVGLFTNLLPGMGDIPGRSTSSGASSPRWPSWAAGPCGSASAGATG